MRCSRVSDRRVTLSLSLFSFAQVTGVPRSRAVSGLRATLPQAAQAHDRLTIGAHMSVTGVSLTHSLSSLSRSSGRRTTTRAVSGLRATSPPAARAHDRIALGARVSVTRSLSPLFRAGG